MPKVSVVNKAGEQVAEIELNSDIFGVEPNEHAVYTVVKNQLANKRQGTQSSKTRAEVRGGGRKPWRQKGTGRARHGSIRSPLWVGGGVTFAPKPRDYSYSVPKKIRRLAMKSILSSKVANDELIVVEDLNLDKISTKEANSILKNIAADKKAYVVIGSDDETCFKSFRNIENVDIAVADKMNVYDIIKHNSLVVTKEAIEKIEEVFI